MSNLYMFSGEDIMYNTPIEEDEKLTPEEQEVVVDELVDFFKSMGADCREVNKRIW